MFITIHCIKIVPVLLRPRTTLCLADNIMDTCEHSSIIDHRVEFNSNGVIACMGGPELFTTDIAGPGVPQYS